MLLRDVATGANSSWRWFPVWLCSLPDLLRNQKNLYKKWKDITITGKEKAEQCLLCYVHIRTSLYFILFWGVLIHSPAATMNRSFPPLFHHQILKPFSVTISFLKNFSNHATESNSCTLLVKLHKFIKCKHRCHYTEEKKI